MSITKESFGVMKDGTEITAYTIINGKGMEATVINFGAILTKLIVPNKAGEKADVVLGYDSLESYYDNSSFFGATIGRSANRIADAKFSIDGVEYKLVVNDGPNNLHTDFDKGIHKRAWEAKVDESSNSVVFFISEEDGETGFPGKMDLSVTYSVTEDNELKINYLGASDKKTLMNCTNHTYFNLSGHDSGDIHDEKLQLIAQRYTPVVAGAIPTGELASVKGTPFDFTEPKRIGDEIDTDNEQLKLVQGYDHNWVIDNYDGKMKKVALVIDEKAGRSMEVFTDLPGIQFYAGNCIADTVGKNGVKYTKRNALCLETQYFPNSINEAAFPQPVLDVGEQYNTTTVYRFI